MTSIRELVRSREEAAEALRDAIRTKGCGTHPAEERRLAEREERLAEAVGLTRPELFVSVINPVEADYQKRQGVGLAGRPWPPEFVDDLVARLEARTV